MTFKSVCLTFCVLIPFILFISFHKSDIPINALLSNMSIQEISENWEPEQSYISLKKINADSPDFPLSWSYFVNSNLQYPYVGIQITDDFEKKFDLSNYDYFDLAIHGDYETSLSFILSLPFRDSELSDQLVPLQIDLIVLPEIQVIRCKISDFYIPVWWLDEQGMKHISLDRLDFSQVQNIFFIQNNHHAPNQNCIQLHDLILGQYIVRLILPGASLAVLLFLIARVTVFTEREKSKLRIHKAKPIIVSQPAFTTKISQYEQIRNYVKNHFTKTDLKISELADALQTPEYMVLKVIQAEGYNNFSRYVNSIRIESAKEMLLSMEKSIISIALTAGFGSLSQFNRVFKDQLGMTPTQYRKRANDN